ncbi:MAG: ABC-type branched-chain amino acid transport system, Extracellular ligand-binding receptor [Actinomycetia bacterium]|nr:ABC-type branched-chain amino acid transport system, Extracellular ligand-binding receptor [Actinomycetes bacterium]
MAQRTLARATAAASVVLLAASAAACSNNSGSSSSSDTTKKQVKVYGTDGNMGNALGAKFKDKGALAGMSGTTPLTKLGDDFKTRLKTVDPKLVDFNYAGESYDASVLVALAAETARSSKGTDLGKFINSTTTGGEKCTDYKSCLALIKAGKDVDYDGVTGPLAFTEAGEPSKASFGLLQFGADNKLDDAKTQYVLAGDESKASTATVQAPPQTQAWAGSPAFKLGTLLPQTGSLAFLGPPEFAGVKLAVQDINAAGGVNGKPITVTNTDSGDTSTDIATTSVDSLIQAGVGAIVGAASSGVSLKVIDKITGAGVVQISPANTSDKFTTYPDKGLYFRTAPPDTLQAKALADKMIADGVKKVGILELNDPYGTGLATNLQKDLAAQGVSAGNITNKIYDPKAQDFSAEVGAMKQANPDAIVVIGFDESATIIKQLNEQGIGPKR